MPEFRTGHRVIATTRHSGEHAGSPEWGWVSSAPVRW
ncbi:hypothetical protein SaccyDRAFT_1817 [Saccharomonospora cyanea NA-134]|uniref:Uncharacterized protein n=1 Tax=Saccharomonospora cyanea NA-134 TaxID=882082 RepID=H5XIU1_9PSEU|nr:hypothetical protein SaccyDRAFT_1817 [Saccharomonospora cyanea NA-134]